ncbi:hypothetical protein MXB_3893, partial [Myxobolus squamalis]
FYKTISNGKLNYFLEYVFEFSTRIKCIEDEKLFEIISRLVEFIYLHQQFINCNLGVYANDYECMEIRRVCLKIYHLFLTKFILPNIFKFNDDCLKKISLFVCHQTTCDKDSSSLITSFTCLSLIVQKYYSMVIKKQLLIESINFEFIKDNFIFPSLNLLDHFMKKEPNNMSPKLISQLASIFSAISGINLGPSVLSVWLDLKPIQHSPAVIELFKNTYLIEISRPDLIPLTTAFEQSI